MIVSIILTTIVDFAILGSNGGGATLAQKAGRLLPGPEIAGQVTVTLGVALLVGLVLWREMRRDSVATQRRFLLVLGGLVAFSAGGSQVGLAIGPMVPLLGDFDVPITAVLVGGGLGLLAGSWTGAPRMIKALSQDYSSLGPRRSIAALIPSFAIAQTAVFFGIPVSFNEIIVSSIIGSGYAAGDSDVSKAKMLYTALAWIGSLCIALGVGYGAFTAIEWLF
jgi:PiT family inorganic phosphate transporter